MMVVISLGDMKRLARSPITKMTTREKVSNEQVLLVPTLQEKKKLPLLWVSSSPSPACGVIHPYLTTQGSPCQAIGDGVATRRLEHSLCIQLHHCFHLCNDIVVKYQL